MSKWAYYQDIDEEKCEWVRELIKAGAITDGEVDCRDIKLVTADDVRGFRRAHFFCGIAVWDYALNRCGWNDEHYGTTWTGSCPCPSFSSAGKGEGFNDPRHLWPVWFRLIRECRPAIAIGEQVEAAIRHGWLDLVWADMEDEDYAFGAAVLNSASVGGADIRQRLYWVAKRLGDSQGSHGEIPVRERGQDQTISESRGDGGTLLHPAADALKGYWRGADWLFCRDGKWRPVEAITQSLADGTSLDMGRLRNLGVPEDAIQKAIEEIGFPLGTGSEGKLMRLRGYGDAINAELATAFIECCDAALCDAALQEESC